MTCSSFSRVWTSSCSTAVTFKDDAEEFVDPVPSSTDEFVEIGSMTARVAVDDDEEEEFVAVAPDEDNDAFMDVDSAENGDDEEADEFADIGSAEKDDDDDDGDDSDNGGDVDDELVANASLPLTPDEDEAFVAVDEDNELAAVTNSISDSLALRAAGTRCDEERKDLRSGRTEPSPVNGTVSWGLPHETQPISLATSTMANPCPDVFMMTGVVSSSPY